VHTNDQEPISFGITSEVVCPL